MINNNNINNKESQIENKIIIIYFKQNLIRNKTNYNI